MKNKKILIATLIVIFVSIFIFKFLLTPSGVNCPEVFIPVSNSNITPTNNDEAFEILFSYVNSSNYDYLNIPTIDNLEYREAKFLQVEKEGWILSVSHKQNTKILTPFFAIDKEGKIYARQVCY